MGVLRHYGGRPLGSALGQGAVLYVEPSGEKGVTAGGGVGLSQMMGPLSDQRRCGALTSAGLRGETPASSLRTSQTIGPFSDQGGRWPLTPARWGSSGTTRSFRSMRGPTSWCARGALPTTVPAFSRPFAARASADRSSTDRTRGGRGFRHLPQFMSGQRQVLIRCTRRRPAHDRRSAGVHCFETQWTYLKASLSFTSLYRSAAMWSL